VNAHGVWNGSRAVDESNNQRLHASSLSVCQYVGLTGAQSAGQYGGMRQVVKKPDVSDTKPLTEPVFLILTSLADQPRHGYALMQDIQQISNERVILSTGTLYGALRRLLEDGLIERFQQADKSRDKQAYNRRVV
jgi:hypothetical protein